MSETDTTTVAPGEPTPEEISDLMSDVAVDTPMLAPLMQYPVLRRAIVHGVWDDGEREPIDDLSRVFQYVLLQLDRLGQPKKLVVEWILEPEFAISDIIRKQWPRERWIEVANKHFDNCRAAANQWRAEVQAAEKQAEAEPPGEAKEPIEFLDITDCKEATLPKRDMLVEDIFERSKLSVLAGQGGTVKSTLAIYLGLSIASGKPAGPFKPTGKYRVGYIGIEDDIIEQRRRMFALLKTPDLKGIKIEEGDLFEGGGAFHTLKCDAATLVKRNEDTGAIEPTEAHRWLVKEIDRLKLDFVIIDPLVEITENVNENDNAHMHKVMALLRLIARQQNVHLMIVHHFNKPGEANNPGAVRGGSSIINAARLVLNVEKANDTDCKANHIDEYDRHNRIKLVISKANNRGSGNTHWFAIEEQHLLNGDFVASVEQWYPASEATSVTDKLIDNFLDQIERGRLDSEGNPTGDKFTDKTSGPKGPRAEQLLINAGLVQDQARRLMRDLAKDGTIAMRPYQNKHYEDLEGLVVLKRPIPLPM